MTVPKLRDLCRARGLPTYQHKGRRLRKADLVAQLERQKHEQCNHDDPMAPMRAEAERALLLDYATASRHATALGIPRSELLDQDAITMHRILHDCARPADERHWRTKEMIRAIVGLI